jgi:glycosyltransferase involved in cell wall biosynthesis
MRILVIASFNKRSFAPFIVEQAEALKRQGCDIDFFGLQGKGIKGYLRNLSSLKRKIKEFRPDVIHAHYGLSGLLANLQRRIPVVSTYHGSDINDKKVLRFSKMTIFLSKWNIFVSKKTLSIAKPKERYSLLPCGIDLSELQLTDKDKARKKMNLEANKHYVLFAGAFDNAVKNASLAKKALALCEDENVELLELKGYTRDEVTLLMCAVDAIIMTSVSEGSPQVIKESMACGCPIVSVDVGDVKERIAGIDGCFVAETRNPQEIAELLKKAMAFDGKTNGHDKIIADGLDNRLVAERLMDIYKRICIK